MLFNLTKCTIFMDDNKSLCYVMLTPLTAFGMDDTRMDLSQFDDGTGRSGATTPRSRTPPTIAITEAPPQEGEAQSTEAVLDRVAGERITPETSSQGQTQDTVPEG